MELHIYKNTEELSLAAAEWISELASRKIKTQGRFTWLLSGGNTPKQLYQLLASERFRNVIDWKRVHVFFGDERFVPFEDERNNGKMAKEALLSHVPIPESQIHYMATDKDPSMASEEYEQLLKEYFDNESSTFDLALLGMGDDGHTLSLFPGSVVIHENKKWVTSFYLDEQGMYRITLTPVVVNRSVNIAFLVAGKSKAGALQEVLQGKFQPERYPSQLIKPVSGELHWFIDEAAASELQPTDKLGSVSV